jgi:hypothetical protein
MRQLILFDDYGPVLTIEQEKQMTWLDLYNFLHKHANDINTTEQMSKIWNQHVMVHNMETDDEYPCDTIITNDRLVLGINLEDS